MKKITGFLLIIVLLFSVSAMGGCAQKDTDAKQSQHIVLRDFEHYNPDFMALQMSRNFGRIEVNTDTKFVTSGIQSAKFTLVGSVLMPDGPSVKIPFFSTVAVYNYKDISKFDSVGMNLYNDETFDLDMYWNFTFFDKQSSQRQKIVLKPGWNKLQLKTDPDMLNMFYDLGDCNGLNLSFDDFAKQGIAEADAPTVYLDDMTLNLTAQKYTAPSVDIYVDPYEICDFEKAYQAHILKPSSETDALPETQILESDGNVLPTKGDKMLKVSFPNGSGGYARLAFSAKLFPIIDFSRFKDEAARYSICYDIFNASGIPNVISTYYIWGGIKEWPNPNLAWNVNMQAQNTRMPMGEWKTYRISLAEIYAWDKRTLEEGFHMFLMAGDNVPKGTSYYLDNFRVEKNW